MTDKITCHSKDPWAERWGQPTWDERGTCSYCGSISVVEAIRLLKIDGTEYSGSDWKYGWPHKYYIGDKEANPNAIKFYNDHLIDASEDELREFSDLSCRYFGIEWCRSEKGLGYRAPKTENTYGYQRWGVVGKVTCPRCGCVEGRKMGFCSCPCHPQGSATVPATV